MTASWLEDLRVLLTDRQVDLGVALRLVIDRITLELEADRGTLYLVDHARQEVVSRVAHLPEIREIRLALGEGVAGHVAREGVVVNSSRPGFDRALASRIDSETGYRTTSTLAVPIRDRDHVVGVIQLLNKVSGGFTVEDEHVLQRRAAQVLMLLEVTSLRVQLRPGQRHRLSFQFNHIIGQSHRMLRAYSLTSRAACSDATVLVRGETGTGKELIARAVHYNSDRREGAFIKVDCAALPANLIENELFGHERGAFTSADQATEGQVHAAAGGTLFLDEIGELPLAVQGKLLRLIQDRTFLRVGSREPQTVDVRFVCATHRDLEADVEAGRFRRDLYYRMRVVEIGLPSLAERGPADIDLLSDHFLYVYGERYGRPGLVLTESARQRLRQHGWPGNVRELEHCMESAVVLSAGAELEESVLPELVTGRSAAVESESEGGFHFGIATLRELETAYAEYVLAACDGNRSRAARTLGIGRNTLQRKLEGR